MIVQFRAKGNRKAPALPRRASRESAASRAAGGACARAVDLARCGGTRPRSARKGGPGPGHGDEGSAGLHPQSPAGGAPRRGDAALRGWPCERRRHRQMRARRARAALVLHGPVRDDRPQRAGGRRRLCSALSADL